MKLKIKICGIREPENITHISELNPDLMGFIFYRLSPRYAGDFLDKKIPGEVPSSVLKTGVFVNEDEIEIIRTVEMYSLDIVQLHGNETPDLCYRLKEKGLPVIKAFRIDNYQSFRHCSAYSKCADYFLFDTTGSGFGGTGKKFDWKILNDYDHQKPFFLSGGISPDDPDRIRAITTPFLYGIDLNSRFETVPGRKDIEKLRQFISEIRVKD